ncbi:MAG TPA: XRE family transcriptional regulator [Lachnospiraceae bacterium]|jgi:transcriptional regulator with XRE-family HTH domain|nr:helix-turn-helix transcriptional regulator [Lachnospiraceae bacterium]MDD6148179.1 helix-turn-helix transcriptional regulator [Lachnospiraceae bacterium]MDY5705245.1 helix-turn-helix transcriptional regulator [Lachnospiraceae bacterium]MEE3357391.1 helix-turn-helix transcriptional regulator [Lachnospiraceae bacterium]HAN50175.1 XRE family transcriptional regulator [Lachnospiraceae bacterium]
MKKRYEDQVPVAVRSVRQEIARQLRSARQSEQMTQQVLADRAGTAKSNISRMESGKYNPSLDFMVKVAGCLGKTISIHLDDETGG